MKFDFSTLTLDGKWHDFGDARLLIRPYPSSLETVQVGEAGIMMSGDKQCEVFKYCLVDWKNVVDAEGKDLPCTDEVKQKIFDFGLENMTGFVLQQRRNFEAAKEEQEKN